MKWLSLVGCTSLLLAVVGCGSNARYPQGAEKGPCYANLTCNAGLTCLSDTCVRAPVPSGTGGSVGPGTGGVVGHPDGPVSAALDASQLDSVDAPLNGVGGSPGTGRTGAGGAMGSLDASLDTASVTPSDTASVTPSGSVVFAAGRAQGAMTGLGWVSLGSRAVLSTPTCGGAPIVGLSSSHMGSAVSSCAPSATTWAADGGLCVSGSIPALPSLPVVSDYDNNWGLQVGVNTSEPPADQGGSTLGVDYTYVTLNVTGAPLTDLRAILHRRGDPDDATYCATFRSETKVVLAAFNTKCWGDATTVLLTDADIPTIDRVGVLVASGSTAINVTNLCLTSIVFEGNSAVGTGGTRGSGGATGAGGKVGTGGVVGTGGTAQPPASVACTDTSTTSLVIDQQYGNGIIAVDNNPNKTYNFQANWWGKFNNQTETINGLGFTLGNPTNTATSDNNPLGFPSMFIGSYQGKTSKGSNLPKQVAALSGVPTILRINTGIDTSNLNASYDVWLTQSNGAITGSSPGSGGAYLMVWLFKPSKRQPRGTIVMDGHSVGGVPGSWNVWYDNTNPPCVSYVSTAPVSELAFDLNDFLQDAVANQWGVTASQYLSLIFAGTEVWGGGDGFQLKQFCADVL